MLRKKIFLSINRGGVIMKGSATLQGTMEYAQRHSDISYQMIPHTGYRVSAAGFGCYRVDVAVLEHQQALEKALLSGINIIDTSANYADGGSEKLVGKILQKLVLKGQLQREEVVVVSKVGYLQGKNYKLSQERKEEGRSFEDLVLYDEGLEHCIHPIFLAEQLTMSLERLGLETIDCYLLHNPEYYLSWAKTQNLEKKEVKREYLRRIKAAFIHLEAEVVKGRISYYGISSNAFVRPENHFEFTSLAQIWDIAESISAQHHFRVIEFPCNLLETAGVTEKNQPENRSLLEFAVEKNLGVLINRPLNAMQEGRLIRLSEKVYQGEAAQQALAFKDNVGALEKAWGNVASLSQLALRVLRSTAGIYSVLVGMRREVYVEDVLHELRQPSTSVARTGTWQQIHLMTKS
jgi:aryl-alcohol dehydrogenase-like predicted oxidoreductase